MSKQSAGILVYRLKDNKPEVFLCHPGGPFHKNKDEGAWQIPKGEFESDEEPMEAAKREFKEEVGQDINGKFIPLTPVKYKTGKIVYAWAVEGDVDEDKVTSNFFSLEWPPKSGKFQEFPEVDRGEWFTIHVAKKKILPALLSFIDELVEKLK